MTAEPIEHTEADGEAFREIAAELVANRLEPLTAPATLDSLTKGVLPIGLGLLFGLGLVPDNVLVNSDLLKGFRLDQARPLLALLAALILISATLTVIGRWMIARSAIAAWENANQRILNRGHAWFFNRVRGELVELGPLLEAALARLHGRADAAAKPGTPPLRLSVIHVGTAKWPVRDTTLRQQFLHLTLLITPALALLEGAEGQDPRAAGWRSALARLRARQAIFAQFLDERLPALARQKRGFLLSFLSLDLLLVPLAALLLVRSLQAAIG